MPSWVKITLVVLAVLGALAVVVALVNPGGHGPGMHGGAANSTDPQESTRRVNVTALDTRFEPASLSVARGEVVTFVVTNAGRADHEFILGDAAMQEQHARMTAHGGRPHDGEGMGQLAPGETKELTWRFDEAGTVLYACHEPGHYDAGMAGEIKVE